MRLFCSGFKFLACTIFWLPPELLFFLADFKTKVEYILPETIYRVLISGLLF